MRSSRGGLGDIPSPGRAGAPPASARPRRATAPGEVFGRKSLPFRRRGIAVCRALAWCDLTPNTRAHYIAAAPMPLLRAADQFQGRPGSVGADSRDTRDNTVLW